MRAIRLVHFYLGIFFAPLVLFFAFTGTLQVFKLHERQPDTAAAQADWIAWFGQFHKEQAWIPPRVAPRKPAEPGAPVKEKKSPESQPMKWLVAVMGISLMVSTLLGLYIAFKYPNRRRGFVAALVAGIAIPLAFMAF
jgi:hypothetical protein